MEKLKIDIAYREKVVTDEEVIANALLTFENTIGEAGQCVTALCDIAGIRCLIFNDLPDFQAFT